MKKTVLFFIFMFFAVGSLGFAQSAEEIYRKANIDYENEDYKEAVSLYEMLLKMDRTNAEVFYNLGNSYFKLKKIGKAIVNYERALRIAPRDRDIRMNLDLAGNMTVDKIKTREESFLLKLIFLPYEKMNLNELTAIVSVFYLSIVALLIFSIFFAEKRRIIFYTTGVFAVFFMVFFVFLAAKINAENFVTHAVVISEKTDVRSGPKEDYLLQFTLHEGTKFKIIEERQGWYEIDLSKDLRGWLPKDSVEII